MPTSLIFRTICIFTLMLATKSPGLSQISTTPAPDLLRQTWQAHWITHPGISGTEPGVYLFKKTFETPEIPEHFVVNISADNRYKLYVNGTFLTAGPCRGDQNKWRFETLDLAAYLQQGENVLAVKVWNFGNLRPVAQFSVETGLIVQSNSAAESVINTDTTWQVKRDSAYTKFYGDMGRELHAYHVVGPGEHFEARLHDWDWQSSESAHKDWSPAKVLEQGMPMAAIRKHGSLPRRALFPREIPLMQHKPQNFARIRSSQGITQTDAILKKSDSLIIPAYSEVRIVLDQEVLTNAYPLIHTSKGKDAQIRLTYAESFFEVEQREGKEQTSMRKGHRDEIEGKQIKGNFDIFIADGGAHRTYESLWWRTFRYVEVEIKTQEAPLTLHGISSLYTAYPFTLQASFDAELPALSQMFEVAWRTQELCAGESFFDCPYYEQLQYAGDTRIQGLVAFYASGDTLLWKKSLIDFYDSRLPMGLTQSRYPSYATQLIPTYSLAWITMLWDYSRHCGEDKFIEAMLPAVEDILLWFAHRLEDNQLLGELEGWNFMDWVIAEGWESGVPPLDDSGQSALYSLQYVYTLQKAAALYRHFGRETDAQRWLAHAAEIQHAVVAQCWDEKRQLISDTPEKRFFSQHANIWAILTESLPEAQAKQVMETMLVDTSLAQASYYFRFYLAEAIQHLDMGDRYLDLLGPWYEMLEMGLTTFMEEPEPSRSDCHAWSASPLYHFYALVCGIRPGSAGFQTVEIKPRLGALPWVKASFPHPKGMLAISLTQTGTLGLEGEITLPQGITGSIEWKGKKRELKSGKNQVRF